MGWLDPTFLGALTITLGVSRRLHRAVTRTRHRIVELLPVERWSH